MTVYRGGVSFFTTLVTSQLGTGALLGYEETLHGQRFSHLFCEELKTVSTSDIPFTSFD